MHQLHRRSGRSWTLAPCQNYLFQLHACCGSPWRTDDDDGEDSRRMHENRWPKKPSFHDLRLPRCNTVTLLVGGSPAHSSPETTIQFSLSNQAAKCSRTQSLVSVNTKKVHICRGRIFTVSVAPSYPPWRAQESGKPRFEHYSNVRTTGRRNHDGARVATRRIPRSLRVRRITR